jgi:hypothetical protein
MMRKLLLASSAVFLLTGGMALANGHGGTTNTTAVVPVQNATSAGLGNSSATTGGSATTASNNGGNTTKSNNGGNTTASNDGGNTIASDNTLNTELTTLKNSDNLDLESTRTDTTVTVLATSVNDGSVSGTTLTIGSSGSDGYKHEGSGGGGLSTGDANMDHVNTGMGILTAQQNTAPSSLQQSSVALGSEVNGGTFSSGGGL